VEGRACPRVISTPPTLPFRDEGLRGEHWRERTAAFLCMPTLEESGLGLGSQDLYRLYGQIERSRLAFEDRAERPCAEGLNQLYCWLSLFVNELSEDGVESKLIKRLGGKVRPHDPYDMYPMVTINGP
jgi:hypothetical protein